MKYYYLDSSNQRHGPFTVDELMNIGISEQTYVWREGMSSWERAGRVSELHVLFSDPMNNETPGQPPRMQNQGRYKENGPTYNNMQPNMGPPPNSNLVWAILSTIFCCLPLGIVSIVYASKVDGLWIAGRYEEARNASKKAGQWALWSAISVAIILVIYFLCIIAGVFAIAELASFNY